MTASTPTPMTQVDGIPGLARRETVTRRECLYCLGSFAHERRHRKTCSGACRMAMSRALALERDGDVELPSLRPECFSKARQAATGWGLMTRRKMYEADLRVRNPPTTHEAPTRREEGT